jgi:hypothetical protein
MITIQQMVDREVQVCLSSLVATLANAGMHSNSTKELQELAEQAFELASPVPDYEEAAIQVGCVCVKGVWSCKSHSGGHHTAESICESLNLDPYDREVYEHWSVSQWLAEKLQAQGEKVDLDFAGMCCWARTTTGQAIHADGVIERIYAAITAPTPPAEHLASIRETLKGV